MDQIDRAIASSAPATPVFRAQLTFERGRSGLIEVPQDLTPPEMVNVVAILVTQVAAALAAADQTPKPRILVPVR